MFRAVFTAAFVALLAGCAAPGGERAEPLARPQRKAIESFQLEGRIAVRRGGENFSAHIDWQHRATADEIVVSGPLGQGLARLSANASGAVLETAEQKRFEAPDLDALSGQVFGASLPVSGMSRWVLGRSAFGGAVLLDAAGRPAGLTERGWTIEYLGYEGEAPDALPVLLRAQREDVELRLKIDSWNLLK